MKKTRLYPFYVGFLCYDGSFAMLIKNHKGIGFETYEDAQEYIKKVQSKYKHRLEVWHNV